MNPCCSTRKTPVTHLGTLDIEKKRAHELKPSPAAFPRRRIFQVQVTWPPVLAGGWNGRLDREIRHSATMAGEARPNRSKFSVGCFFVEQVAIWLDSRAVHVFLCNASICCLDCCIRWVWDSSWFVLMECVFFHRNAGPSSGYARCSQPHSFFQPCSQHRSCSACWSVLIVYILYFSLSSS